MDQSTVYIELPEKPHTKTLELVEELLLIVPNSQKKAAETEITEKDTILKIQEDIGPQYLIWTNKENQFVFKIIEYRSRASLGINSVIKQEHHQLVLSKFTTDLGLKVASFLMGVFPINVESNQVVNFTVHKDFIYFRMYRTCITAKGPKFEKIGPHLSLRLWRITDYEGENKKIHKYQKYVKNLNLL